MKPLIILMLLGFAAGCADNSQPADEVREHFERGISGEGQVVPLNHEGQANLNPPTTQPGPTP